MTARKIIAAKPVCDLLEKKGIIPPNCRRVVIDLEADGAAMLYCTVYGDERLLEVMQDVEFRIKHTEE